MKTDKSRKATLIDSIMKKDKAMIQALITEKSPPVLVYINPGDPVPPDIPGYETLYVQYVPGLNCRELATSEDQVDLTRPNRIIELPLPQQTENDKTIDNLGAGGNPSIQNDPDATEKQFSPDVPSIF